MEFTEEIKRGSDFIMNQFGVGIMIVAYRGENKLDFEFINETFAQMIGYEYEELVSLMKADVRAPLYPADYNKVFNNIAMLEPGHGVEGYFRMKKKTGESLWVLGHCAVNRNYEEAYAFLTVTDIEKYEVPRDRLSLSETIWQDIVNSVPVGLLIFSKVDSETSITEINDSLVRFANYVGGKLDGQDRNWSKEELMLLFNQSIYAFCENDDKGRVDEMLLASESMPISNCRFRLRGSSDEKTIWIYSTCSSKMTSEGNRSYYVTFQDVTADEKLKAELQASHDILQNLNHYDTLTGVRSRNYYNKFVETCRKQKISNVGIAFADVNGLKMVNDKLGHQQGDYLIRSFTNIMIDEFGRDHIYRISGDEFVVVVWDIEREKFMRQMRRAHKAILDGGNVASVGYIWKENVSDIRRRVKQAEELMYLEKKKFYEDKSTLLSKHRNQLQKSVIEGIESRKYCMYLQPKACIGGKKIIGAEALVRYHAKDGQIIPPYEFIPQLEAEKLISYVDFFMLDEVCNFLDVAKKKGDDDIKISVNMSRVTMAEDDFFERIIATCSKYDINNNQLEFEITESNHTMDDIRMEEDIRRLKQMGFGISLDDVGTEYSSFPMLIMDGIDTVKIDRSFILKYKDPKVDKMLSHIISMCHDLGQTVIAEGIETDEERLALMAKDCDLYQGYLLSKPIPVDDFVAKFLTK